MDIKYNAPLPMEYISLRLKTGMGTRLTLSLVPFRVYNIFIKRTATTKMTD